MMRNWFWWGKKVQWKSLTPTAVYPTWSWSAAPPSILFWAPHSSGHLSCKDWQHPRLCCYCSIQWPFMSGLSTAGDMKRTVVAEGISLTKWPLWVWCELSRNENLGPQITPEHTKLSFLQIGLARFVREKKQEVVILWLRLIAVEKH